MKQLLEQIWNDKFCRDPVNYVIWLRYGITPKCHHEHLPGSDITIHWERKRRRKKTLGK